MAIACVGAPAAMTSEAGFAVQIPREQAYSSLCPAPAVAKR